MIRICWWFVDIVSLMLEPDDRDAVRGDYEESGEPCGRALRGLVSLIIRRQLALWKEWRPWLALVGLVGIVAVLLSAIALRLDVTVSQQLRTYLAYGVPFETGLTIGQDIVYMGCLALALLAWSWTGGFVLGSLSGRASWLTGALFYLVVLDSFTARLLISGNLIIHEGSLPSIILGWFAPLTISRVLFTVAVIGGINRGLRLRTLGMGSTLVLAAGTLILTALVAWTSGWIETAEETWSRGLWHGRPSPTSLLPLALLSWPVAYLLATASWQRWRGSASPN
jgi:hypothetical protein